EELLTGDLNAVLARMTAEVERLTPGIVVVDFFRNDRTCASVDAVSDSGTARSNQPMIFEQFVQQLALYLTTWEVTSLLIGEYTEQDQRQARLTIDDGILLLQHGDDGESGV